MQPEDYTRKKPGPISKPKEVYDKNLAKIKGVEFVTTDRQLVRLSEYYYKSLEEREPCLRLGATTPPKKKPGDTEDKRKAHSTWVVTYPDGNVEIIRLYRDPRAAYRWMMNDQRPWNSKVSPVPVELAEI